MDLEPLYIQPLGTFIFFLILLFISFTYYHKKYEISLIATIPVGIEYEGEPFYFPYFGMGFGFRYWYILKAIFSCFCQLPKAKPFELIFPIIFLVFSLTPLGGDLAKGV